MQTQVTPSRAPAAGSASISLFVALSCVYVLLARGRITSIDEWHVYGTTESLVERGSWQLEIEGVTRKYSRYSVVPSLVGVPFYKVAELALGDAAAPGRTSASQSGASDQSATAGGVPRREVLQAAVSLETALVTAAAAAVLLFGLCRLGVAGGAALATALVYAFGTLALPYCGSMYTQPLAALGIACLVTSMALGSSVWSAVSLVLLLVVRLEFLVLLPVLTMHAWRFQRPARGGLAWLAGTAAVGLGINVFVNNCRGDPLLIGDYGGEAFTTPVTIGLHGLLVSPGKGLFWFAPAAAAGLVLMPRLLRAAPRVGFLVVGMTATLLVLAACWWTWHGARSWGPRLLVPLMPVLMLPLAWVFADWQQRPAGLRLLLVVVIVASVAVQFCGTLRDPVSESMLMWPPLAANENESIYIPQTGPWGVEGQLFPDVLLVRLWANAPDWRGAVLAASAALLVVALATGLATLRALALPAGALRAILPPAQPPELAAVAVALLLVAAPSALSAILARSFHATPQREGSSVPEQFARLTPAPQFDRLTGHLFVPLAGEYFFYRPPPYDTRFVLDHQPVFRGGTGGGLAVRELTQGFHRLEVEAAAPGRFAELYWTTPGLAHYKEPVARLYLVADVSWRDRAAIALVHWRWAVWIVVVAGLLFVVTRPAPHGENA